MKISMKVEALSPSYLSNIPRLTIVSNLRKLIKRFSNLWDHFFHRIARVGLSLCGSNGENGGKPLRGTFTDVGVEFAVELVAETAAELGSSSSM